MTRKQQSLKPDTVLKNYWRNNDRFADLFNAALFGGRQIIRPEELEDQDTALSAVLPQKDHARSLEASRDHIKICKRSSAHNVELVMLGKEAQSRIHYAMPLRVMEYDYLTYKNQYDNNAAKYLSKDNPESPASHTRKDNPESLIPVQFPSTPPSPLDSSEYLSRMRRTDKFIPVITIVVYYGEGPWDGAKSLHEMLDIPRGFAQYVNDYKMLLIEARNPGLMFHNMDNIDFFNLMKIILNRDLTQKEARESAIQYSEAHQTDPSVIMAIAGATNTNIDYNAFEKGDLEMCTLFEEIAEEGRVEGIIKGRAEGRAEGKTEGRAEEIIETGYEFSMSNDDILNRLQTKLNIPLPKAQEYFNMFKKPDRGY